MCHYAVRFAHKYLRQARYLILFPSIQTPTTSRSLSYSHHIVIMSEPSGSTCQDTSSGATSRQSTADTAKSSAVIPRSSERDYPSWFLSSDGGPDGRRTQDPTSYDKDGTDDDPATGWVPYKSEQQKMEEERQKKGSTVVHLLRKLTSG